MQTRPATLLQPSDGALLAKPRELSGLFQAVDGPTTTHPLAGRAVGRTKVAAPAQTPAMGLRVGMGRQEGPSGSPVATLGAPTGGLALQPPRRAGIAKDRLAPTRQDLIPRPTPAPLGRPVDAPPQAKAPTTGPPRRPVVAVATLARQVPVGAWKGGVVIRGAPVGIARVMAVAVGPPMAQDGRALRAIPYAPGAL